MADNIFNTYGSLSTNGVLASVYERSAFSPSNAALPYYAGRGTPPPTLASSVVGSDISMQSIGLGGEPGAANTDAATEAANDPFNMAKSPVLWAVVFLIVGVTGLRYIHWRH